MSQTVKAIAESINIMGTRSGNAMKDPTHLAALLNERV